MSEEEIRDQRRLHAWPDWDESIRAARTRLGFDPGWTPKPGEAPSDDFVAWQRRVELRRLLAEAGRAVIVLRLSDRFKDYWLACFLAPYEADGFERILDLRPDRTLSDDRVFPPPMDLWFEAGIDYSMVPYGLVIEGPAALASTTVLRAAMRRALAAKRRAGFPAQHPLSRARQVGPVLEERATARSQPNPVKANAIRRARAWRANGEKPGFIAYRLGQRGYRVSERTVRRWLAASTAKNADTSSGLHEMPSSDS